MRSSDVNNVFAINFFSLLAGAAIEEGTLKPGDRLLEVNGTSVDGMSQSEVVTLLRNAPLDSSVNLVIVETNFVNCSFFTNVKSVETLSQSYENQGLL